MSILCARYNLLILLRLNNIRKIVEIIRDDHYWKMKHRKGNQLPKGIQVLRKKIEGKWTDPNVSFEDFKVLRNAASDYAALTISGSHSKQKELHPTRHRDTHAFYSALSELYWSGDALLGAEDLHVKAENIKFINEWVSPRYIQAKENTQRIINVINAPYWNDKSSKKELPRGIKRLRDILKKYSFDDGTFDARFEKEFLAECKKVGTLRDRFSIFHPSRTDEGRKFYDLLRHPETFDENILSIEQKITGNPAGQHDSSVLRK